jgi:uncharacterized protein (UPF0332 family)
MKPEDFLILAKELHLSGNEAALRSATSRAYYAAFHKGREMLASMNFKLSTGPAAHGEICNYLQNSGDSRMEAAGQKLGSLRSIRNKADYRLDIQHVATHSNTSLHLADAEKIIDALGATETISNVDKIQGSIEAYIEKLKPKPEAGSEE